MSKEIGEGLQSKSDISARSSPTLVERNLPLSNRAVGHRGQMKRQGEGLPRKGVVA